MTTDYEPELGQASFGNKWEKYECPEFVEALLFHIIKELDRVHWNKYQAERDPNEKCRIAGTVWNPYYWGVSAAKKSLPNFQFKKVKIHWYKYPGRGMSVDRKWNEHEWVSWFNECIKSIRDWGGE